MEEERRYCLNCDNKHGCKSGTPPCIAEMEKDGVSGLPGKEYLIAQRKQGRCSHCPYFRSCWTTEEHARSCRQAR
jgi:hypothetical protein